MSRYSFKLQIIIGMMLVCGLLSVFLMQRKQLGDYGNYYYGSSFALRGDNLAEQVYDVHSFNSNVLAAGERNFFLNHCTVTPQTILFFVPFAVISNAALSKTVFVLFSLLIFLYAFLRFASRFFPDPDWSALFIVAAGIVCIHYNIQQGQSWLLVTGLLMFAFLKSDDAPVLSGFLFAIAILLKLSPIFLLLIFLVQRKWKLIVSAFVFCVLFSLAFALLFKGGSDVLIEFYSHSLFRLSAGYFSDPYSSSFQSFIVLLRNLFVDDHVLNPLPIWSGTERSVQFVHLCFTGILATLIAGAWNNQTGTFARVRIILLFLLLTSGYTSAYSLVILLPFLSVKEPNLNHIKPFLYAIVLAAPSRLFEGANPFLEQYKMWIMLVLFCVETIPYFTFRVIRKEQAAVAVIMVMFFTLKSLNRPESLPVSYFKPEAIAADYVTEAFMSNDSLHYVINEKGSLKVKAFELKPAFNGAQWQSRNNVEVKLHHVNVILMAQRNEELLILSDYRRGPGLFHLYTMPLAELERLKSESR